LNLYKAIGSIGGLTMVSRVLGLVRDILTAKVLGTSHSADAFNVAFWLPNIFRRLFAEGAFSSGFVPLFSRRLAAGGQEDARQFTNEILAVFMPALLAVTVVFQIIMYPFLEWVVSGYQDTPGKLELAVELSRWTFPYLMFISLASLLSGVLNSLDRFAVAAFIPSLLNIALIIALVVGPDGNTPEEQIQIARYMALAVLIGGVAQFALAWATVRRLGVKLHFGRPRITPAVRELIVLILPATAAAGVYQFSQLFYTYFASSLGEGALSSLFYADRLNQLPLSIIGTALGVAILPSISRAIEHRKEDEAADVQARAFDLAMLLTLPATLALAVAAQPIIAGVYQRGEFTADDTRTISNILAILVSGLPAYVLVKVLQPAFYARKDVKTPVYIAMSLLALSVPANFLLIPHLGIYSLAFVTSAQAWINFMALFAILYVRGHFRMPKWLVGRVMRQLIAALAMVAAIYGIQIALADWFAAGTGEQIMALGALVATGMVIYFGVAWVIGGIDKQALADLRRRKAPQ
jgi:putative peptidoglycan lipid II flippase